MMSPLHHSVSVSSSEDSQICAPFQPTTQSRKVPGTNRMITTFSSTQWIPPPRTHQTPIMTKLLNSWLWLMFGLHCWWYCPLLLLFPFKSIHLTKWKQQQKHKQKPSPSSTKAKPHILISFKSNCSKWLVELGHFPLLPLNWKYNCGGQ